MNGICLLIAYDEQRVGGARMGTKEDEEELLERFLRV